MENRDVHPKEFAAIECGDQMFFTGRKDIYKPGDKVTIREVSWGWGDPPTGKEIPVVISSVKDNMNMQDPFYVFGFRKIS